MSNRIDQTLRCNTNNQTRTTTSDVALYTIVTKTINKNTLTVYTSNYEKATADPSKFIHFSITLNGANYTNYEKIFIKFRQSSLTPVNALLYQSNDAYLIMPTEYKVVHYYEELGVTYRYIDITNFVANDPNGTIYFAITTENNDSLDLYTESSSYDPVLEVSYYIESDFYKKQPYIESSIGSSTCLVNARTGKLNYISNLISTTSPKMPLNLSLHYNESYSHKSTITSSINTYLPYGFKLNYQQYLYKTGTRYYYIDESFKTHTFELVDNYDELDLEDINEVYKEIDGNYLILKIMNNYDIIQTIKGDSFIFNKSGYLITIESIYNTNLVITISYDSNNKITQITDGMGIKTKVVHYTESTTKNYIFFFYNTETVSYTILSDLLNNSTAYIESTSNQLTKIKDMTNVITTYEYDVISNTPSLRIIPTISYNLLKKVKSLSKIIEITHNTTKKVSSIIQKSDSSSNIEFNEYIFRYKGRTTEVDRYINGNSSAYDTQIYKFNDKQEVEHSYTKRNNKFYNFTYDKTIKGNNITIKMPKGLINDYINVCTSEKVHYLGFIPENNELNTNLLTYILEVRQKETVRNTPIIPQEIIGYACLATFRYENGEESEHEFYDDNPIYNVPIYNNYYESQIICFNFPKDYTEPTSIGVRLTLEKDVEVINEYFCINPRSYTKTYILNNLALIHNGEFENVEVTYNESSQLLPDIITQDDISSTLCSFSKDHNNYSFWYNEGRNVLYSVNNAEIKKNILQTFSIDTANLCFKSYDSRNVHNVTLSYNNTDYAINKTIKTTSSVFNTETIRTIKYNYLFDVVEEVLDSGVVRKYEYDYFGNIIKTDLIKDKTMNESKVSYNYNQNNDELYKTNKYVINHIGENVSTSTYNQITNLKSVTNYKNQLIGSYEYTNNLLTKITHGINSGETIVSYNDKGLLESYQQGSDIYSIEYNDLDEITSISLNNFKLIENSYDHRSDRVIVTSIINETDTYVNTYDLYGNLHINKKVINEESNKIITIDRQFSVSSNFSTLPNEKVTCISLSNEVDDAFCIQYGYMNDELVSVMHSDFEGVLYVPKHEALVDLEEHAFIMSKETHVKRKGVESSPFIDALHVTYEKTNTSKEYWQASYVNIGGNLLIHPNQSAGNDTYLFDEITYSYKEKYSEFNQLLKIDMEIEKTPEVLFYYYSRIFEYYDNEINDVNYKTPNIKKETHKIYKTGMTNSEIADANSIISEYQYDENNNIISDNTTYNCNNTVSLNEYQYDEFNRLIRENNKIRNETYVYTYDNKGNITNKKTYSYSSGTNELSSLLTNIDYLYYNNTDNNGKYNSYMLKSYAGKTVQYDSAHRISRISYGNDITNYYWNDNRLTKVEYSLGDISKVEFEYNSLGERTLKKIYNREDNANEYRTHEYKWYNGKLIEEQINYRNNSNNNTHIIYLYGNGKLIGFNLNEEEHNNYFYIYNIQNEIIGIQHNDEVVALYYYDAWGNHKTYNPNGIENTSSTFIGNINPFRYKKYYYDVETNLFLVTSRYYSPELGRFIQPADASSLNPRSIHGLNLYAYANNNPIGIAYSSSNVSFGTGGGMVNSLALGGLSSPGYNLVYSNSFDIFAGLNLPQLNVKDLVKDTFISLGEVGYRIAWGLTKNGRAFLDFHYSAYGINGYTALDNLPSTSAKIFKDIGFGLMALDVIEAGYYSYQNGHSFGQGALNVGLTAGKNILVYKVSTGVATAVGTWAGAKLGASLGSYAGPVGFAIGAVAGAVVGWVVDEFGDVIIDWVVGWFD